MDSPAAAVLVTELFNAAARDVDLGARDPAPALHPSKIKTYLRDIPFMRGIRG
jgi:hypothetical protein